MYLKVNLSPTIDPQAFRNEIRLHKLSSSFVSSWYLLVQMQQPWICRVWSQTPKGWNTSCSSQQAFLCFLLSVLPVTPSPCKHVFVHKITYTHVLHWGLRQCLSGKFIHKRHMSSSEQLRISYRDKRDPTLHSQTSTLSLKSPQKNIILLFIQLPALTFLQRSA